MRGVSNAVILHADPVLSFGVIAHWTLDNTGAGYVDTVGGLTLAPSGGGVGTATGVAGNAASFGGAGVLVIPDTAVFTAQVGFAIDVWVYPISGAGYVIAKDNQGSSRDWVLYMSGTTPIFAIWDAAGNAVELNFSLSTPLNTWTHLVVALHTGTSGNVRAYRNGVAAGTASRSSFRNVCPNLGVGGQGNGSSYFTGRIDEPRIWQFGASGDPGAAFWLDRYNGAL